MQAAGPDTWAGQGPESFDNQKSNGSKAKLAAVAVAVVLLGGVAFGAYWLWGRGEATAGATTTTTAQAPTARTSPSQPPDELPVAELPGGTERHPEVKRFADVPSLNYLNDDELQVYKKLKPGKTKFRVQHFDNGNLAVFLLVKSPSLENSDEIEQKLAEIQESNGAKLRKDAPAGVAVTEYTATDDNLAQIRAHYFSENVLVRVEVISKDGLKSANTQFDSIIKKQLQELPADG